MLRGCNWSPLHAAISFKLYRAQPAKSALLRCHFITHSLAAGAHVAPGSWSTAVSLLHRQRSSFWTRTEVKKHRVSERTGRVSVCLNTNEHVPGCTSFSKYSKMCCAAFNACQILRDSLWGMTSAGQCHQCPTCREGRGGEVSGSGGHSDIGECKEGKQSTIPQDVLTGSNKKHQMLTKQTSNTNVSFTTNWKSSSLLPKVGSETFALFHLQWQEG